MPSSWGSSWGSAWGSSWNIAEAPPVIDIVPGSYVQNMYQTATYWPPLINDGFGQVTFDTPIRIRCRWQDDQTLFRDPKGREQTSSSIVYPDRELEIRGYLVRGDETDEADPTQVEGALEIRQQYITPSLGATRKLHKVFL